MTNEALLIATLLWSAAGVLALLQLPWLSRALLGLGAAAAIVGALGALPDGSAAAWLPLGLGGSSFTLTPAAAWLMLFGLIAALPAALLSTPARSGRPGWCFGAALSLLGALGVFGLQDAFPWMAAWEMMSVGGAVMLLSERISDEDGRPSLFMLALLEVGSVALILALLLLANGAGSFAFADFPRAALGGGAYLWVGVLLLIGFGAKLGLLPFYEWFPRAYGSGSGATGTLMSGIVLNAAFFGLARGLSQWLPISGDGALGSFHALVVAIAVVSSILTTLYAFQQDEWRSLLAFSSAENAALAVALLGASMVFGRDRLPDLAGLAWFAALLHLAGHSLAKGALFLGADGVFGAAGSYAIRQGGLLRRAAWPLGLGVLLAGGSLAAMPPQAGFVSEWYLFQTMFQGFQLSTLGNRLLLVSAGAGLALTVAISLATMVKLIGVGLLGAAPDRQRSIDLPHALAVGALGVGVTILAAGLPVWLSGLTQAAPGYAHQVAGTLREGWLLVPLTSKFAFISPSLLVIVMPLLALLPILLLFLGRGWSVRRSAVWYGGKRQPQELVATTALTFSNALREFYSFVYRPRSRTERELAEGSSGQRYFVTRLDFSHEVAPIFGPLLFRPIERLTIAAAVFLRRLQSGHLNLYLALIGLLLVIAMIVPLFRP
jgi:formate hydrogenlyase subunit 3/multisubunit Na+/H+ antiporter MnhD subunit